jgi:4-hydroxy-2-oxoheptanedioate aldolase
MNTNKLKLKLQKGEAAFGPFCKFQDPAAIEIAALAGFDFVIIDLEHGPLDVFQAQNLIRAAESRGITPIIRVSENSESNILRCLDIGAHAVQVPQISNRQDAEQVVKNTRYFPQGERGVCRYVRAAGYSSVEKTTYFKAANNQVLTIIHIEGLEGIKNLDEILKVEGIDVIFLGPYDLSQSCGVPGQIHHEKVQNSMMEAVSKAKKLGKIVGTFVETPEDAKKWKEIGVQYISYSVDVGILLNAYTSIVSRLK